MRHKQSFVLHCTCGGLEVTQFENDEGKFCTTVQCTQEKEGTVEAMRRTLRGILFNFLDHLAEPAFVKLYFSGVVERYDQDSNNPTTGVVGEWTGDSDDLEMAEIMKAGRDVGLIGTTEEVGAFVSRLQRRLLEEVTK